MKIHARVTREVEISEEEMMLLIKASLNGEDNLTTEETKQLSLITDKIVDGINPGGYEFGYIPGSWLEADAVSQIPKLPDALCFNDIEI